MSSITLTSLQISIFSNMTYFIQRMGYRYLILTEDYSSQNSTNLVIKAFVLNINTTISSWSFAVGSKFFNYNFINGTNGIKTVTFIRGLNINSTDSSKLIDIGINIYCSETSIEFWIISNSGTPTFAKSIAIDVMIYNNEFFNRNNFAAFLSGEINGYNSTSLQYVNASNVYELTTMVGITYLKKNQ